MNGGIVTGGFVTTGGVIIWVLHAFVVQHVVFIFPVVVLIIEFGKTHAGIQPLFNDCCPLLVVISALIF